MGRMLAKMVEYLTPKHENMTDEELCAALQAFADEDDGPRQEGVPAKPSVLNLTYNPMQCCWRFRRQITGPKVCV